MYNFPNKRLIKSTTLYNQCCKDYFYDEDNTVESYLAEIEGDCSNVIKRIIQDNSLLSIDDNNFLLLCFFTLIQNARTESSLRLVNDMIGSWQAKIEELKGVAAGTYDDMVIPNRAHLILLKNAELSYPILSDMKLSLLINETDNGFITSDHSLILTNPLLETYQKYGIGYTGTSQKGLIILFPISSKHCLVFYDPYAYHFGKGTDVIRLNKPEQIESINKAVGHSSFQNFYFSPNEDLSSISKLVKKICWKNKSNHRGVVQQGDLLHDSIKSGYTGFNIPEIMVVKKKAKREIAKVFQSKFSLGELSRNPMLMGYLERFREEVKNSRYGAFEFFRYLDDLGVQAI